VNLCLAVFFDGLDSLERFACCASLALNCAVFQSKNRFQDATLLETEYRLVLHLFEVQIHPLYLPVLGLLLGQLLGRPLLCQHL
jgi:hypothetical protein